MYRKAYSACVILICTLAAAGCGGGSSGDAPTGATAAAWSPPSIGDGPASKAAFWDAFHSANIEAIPAARDRLKAVLNANPRDDEAARLIGMSYGLTFMEGPHAQPPVNAPDDVPNALKYLKLSTTLPRFQSEKLFNTAFYAATLATQAAQAHDTATAQQADSMLNQVAQRFPVLGLLDIGAVDSLIAAAGTPTFQNALDAYFRVYEICTGGPVDRQVPDLTRALHGPFPDPLCGNTANVPHLIQGELFTFADDLAKNQQLDAARAVFEDIKQSDGYDTWMFRTLVDERLSALAAGSQTDMGSGGNDGGPGGAPGGLRCLGCHQN